MERNTVNLRANADFCTQIYKGVNWVPVNKLGMSRYDNNELESICKDSPEEKRKKISNLYELIQLMQVGNFGVMDDNTYEQRGDLLWEYHTKGYDAVKTNRGCCATVASFGNYLLNEKYDETGLISISSLSGNGHVINYIKRGDEIYVVDLFSMTNNFINGICTETGLKKDYVKTSIPTSILMKVDSFECFANFFWKYMYLRSKEYLFFKHSCVDCPPIAVKRNKEETVIFYHRTKYTTQIKTARDNKNMRVDWVNF